MKFNLKIKKNIISIAGMTFSFFIADLAAEITKIDKIENVIISSAFSDALRDGLSIPLFVHLESNSGNEGDLKLGRAFIWLDGRKLKIRRVELEDNDDGVVLNDSTREVLMAMKESILDSQLKLPVGKDAWLEFNLRQMALQLSVRKAALGTMLRPRSEDIGESSVNKISSTMNYNLGIFNNQMRNSGSNTSNYFSLNNITALREHHIGLDASLYGLGTPSQNITLYRAMYERDFNGHRFAAGMLNAWNLQSLGPVTAISSGNIYGMSWGNQASSTVFDNSQSVVPVLAFLPAAGEVHLSRDGRLLSVQNFGMGNHEVNTGGLSYGSYDILVEVIVNGQLVSKRQQRVTKLFTRGQQTGAPLSWQLWGGRLRLDRWNQGEKKIKAQKDSWLIGVSGAGKGEVINWAATGYAYDRIAIAESRFIFPLTEYVNISQQNMLASDRSLGSVSSLNINVPGGFSSFWINKEKSSSGDNMRRDDVDNRAIGGSLNLNLLSSSLGTLSVSYNEDNLNKSHYYNADYYQNIYSGSYGTLGLRAGIQRYNNGSMRGNTGKYVAIDFSLPLGNWISTGISTQNGYTMANVSARKQFSGDYIRSVGGNISRAISGGGINEGSLSGGGWAQYDTRYSTGTLNVNSSVDGYISTNLTSYGSLAWQGRNFSASGLSDGNAGIIFNSDIDNSGKLSAKVNGRVFQLKGKTNYLPLPSYSRYEVELQNSKDSLDSFDVVKGRRTKLTLYPGNVAIIEPVVKKIVTVFGRIRVEDGTLLTNAYINNHIGRARTDDRGEFVMDIDKKFPSINISLGENKTCEIPLDLNNARGAIWVGDLVCFGFKYYAGNTNKGSLREE